MLLLLDLLVFSTQLILLLLDLLVSSTQLILLLLNPLVFSTHLCGQGLHLSCLLLQLSSQCLLQPTTKRTVSSTNLYYTNMLAYIPVAESARPAFCPSYSPP